MGRLVGASLHGGLVVQRLRRRSHTAKTAGSNPAEPIRPAGASPLTRTQPRRRNGPGSDVGVQCRLPEQVQVDTSLANPATDTWTRGPTNVEGRPLSAGRPFLIAESDTRADFRDLLACDPCACRGDSRQRTGCSARRPTDSVRPRWCLGRRGGGRRVVSPPVRPPGRGARPRRHLRHAQVSSHPSRVQQHCAHPLAQVHLMTDSVGG